jgi:hypothetical protein
MRAAIDRGDIDEAARQGAQAGPAVIERALAAPDRSARLAAIAAAPISEDRAELLTALAHAAGGADRRVAIPAAYAARQIARDLTRHELADDLAPEDIASWRAAWFELARDHDRWIELRIVALDTAAALDPAIDPAALADPDPAFRRAVIAVVPMPVPTAMRAPLAAIVAKDADDSVALDAAAALCADLVADPRQPILDALGAAGIARIKSLASKASPVATRAIGRCLKR